MKNIVIIGASFAGHALANTLSKSLPPEYRIVLIDQSEFALHAPAVVRAVVVPGTESRNLTALVTQAIFPADSRHRVLAPVAVEELRTASVLLDTEFEGSTELPFEKCMIATGATQPAPLRQPDGMRREDYRALLRGTQRDLEAAERVLIIGGGACGVEIAGELSAHYPKKKIALVHSRERLLQTAHQSPDPVWGFSYSPTPERLSDALEKQLLSRGVELALGERVVFPNGPVVDTEWDGSNGALGAMKTVRLTSSRTLEADYVLVSTGNIPNSSLVAAADPAAVTPDGYVVVEKTLRILASPASPLSGEYYAIGDVANIPGRKTAQIANMTAIAFGKLLATAIKSGKPAGEYVPTKLSSTIICLGDTPENVGAGVLSLGWWGEWWAPTFLVRRMARDYFAKETFFSRFVGERKVGPEDG